MALGGFPLVNPVKVTVTTAATAVRLSTTVTAARQVWIQADDGNGANVIFLGGPNVTSDLYTRRLLVNEIFDIGPLVSGGANLGLIDCTSIWVCASADSQVVQWGYI